MRRPPAAWATPGFRTGVAGRHGVVTAAMEASVYESGYGVGIVRGREPRGRSESVCKSAAKKERERERKKGREGKRRGGCEGEERARERKQRRQNERGPERQTRVLCDE